MKPWNADFCSTRAFVGPNSGANSVETRRLVRISLSLSCYLMSTVLCRSFFCGGSCKQMLLLSETLRFLSYRHEVIDSATLN